MQFFMWYDDTPHKTAAEKIQAAVAAYVVRFTMNPELVLVNIVDFVAVAGLQVDHDRKVPPNTFWVRIEKNAGLEEVANG
ncbi:MAG: hypothetical protein GFH27_549291n363 [Chloroflexi bacterium AL-W]|nr:hypothetical protein [Chloroflexi bacterium AL-N1]NOK67169.1 hypothetical protein [Chloroflexi bacterium AL-N10]NOK75337.1 hypothetical protein [Chloroflexi bacterium AL-N5]NOK82125.1 hypothetical protein [Chloroflexi bacterium AL-W]NOK89970.1 hypothetical protein [Chloroflexi bacterium AL-N15]